VPLLILVFVGVLGCDDKFFGEFFIDFVFEFVRSVSLIVVSKDTKASEHDVTFADYLDSVVIIATHVIIIIMYQPRESFPN